MSEVKDLNTLLTQRADKELKERITDEFRGVTKLSDMCPTDTVTIPPIDSKGWQVTIDGQPIGDKTLRVSHRLFLRLLQGLIIACQRQGNRERIYREFLQKFDALQLDVSNLRDEQP